MNRVMVDAPVWVLGLLVRAAELARSNPTFTENERMGLQSAVFLLQKTIAGAEPNGGPPKEPGTLEHYLNTVAMAGFLEVAATWRANDFKAEGARTVISELDGPGVEAVEDFAKLLQQGEVWFEPEERQK